jgi:hypothetical protein
LTLKEKNKKIAHAKAQRTQRIEARMGEQRLGERGEDRFRVKLNMGSHAYPRLPDGQGQASGR